MAVAGRLEIELLANVARLQSDLNSGVGMVTRATKQMESAVAMVGSAFAALGVSLGVGAFTALIKGSIDAADKLNDLSKSTGLAVEQLAGLRVAAKQSGGDIDSIAASINKLSVNIGKDPEKFKALGVTAKEPLEALKQLADVFASIQDPQLRAALGAEALGKAWAGAAPLLAEGGAKIGEMVEQGSRLSGMSKEIAEQADALNDKLVLLTGTGGLMTRIVGDLLPLLNLLADDLVDVQKQAGNVEGSFNPLLEAFKAVVVFGGNVSFVLKAIGKDLGATAAQMAAFASGNFREVFTIREMAIDDAAKARREFDAWERSILKVGGAATVAADKLNAMDQVSRRMASNAAAAARAENEAAARRARAFIDGDGTAKRAAASNAEAERLRKLDIKGWVEYIEERERLDKALADALVKIADDAQKEKERLRQLDLQGWVAYAQEVFDEADRLQSEAGKGIKSNIQISDEAKKDLEEFLDPAKAKSFGDALADGFGKAGSALGKLVVAFEAYGRKEAEIAAARKRNADIDDPAKRAANEIKLAEMSAQAQISAYGDMAAAAKGFFEAGSSGYKALEAAEKVFRAFELASAIQTMLTKSGLLTAFTTLFVASKATETAATIASVPPALAADAAKGASAAAVGVATQAQGDPYTAWIRMAAMAATMAALGFAVAGSFGGGGGGMTAAQRQRTQGTGTVLGDPTAKSNSLIESIKEIEAIDRIGLTYTHDMLQALRSIDNAMSNLAVLIFRTTGITTGTDIGVQGLGTTTTARPLVGGLDSLNQSIADALGFGKLVNGILGLWGKTTKEITDAGIRIMGTVGELIAGVGIQSFANVRTTTSSWFGLSKDESNSTELGAIDPRLLQQFRLIFGGIVDSVEAAAKALDIWFPGMSESLRNFVVDLGDISLKDLKGQELKDALNSIFSTFGDRLAESVLPTEFLDRFQKVGEGAFQTMMRIAAENELVKHTFKALGLSINATGMAATIARIELVELAGSAEDFARITGDYFDLFYTDAEQFAFAQASVSAEFDRLGVTMPTSIQGFRDLVGGIDLSTEAGRELFIDLMKLAPAFYEVTDSILGLDGRLHSSADVLRQTTDLQEDYDVALWEATNGAQGRSKKQIDDQRRLADAYTAGNYAIVENTIRLENENIARAAAVDRRRNEMSLEAQLMEAQGNRMGALAIQRALETEGMNAAELASYNYTQALRAAIDAQNALNDQMAITGDLTADLLEAQGDTTGAAAARRNAYIDSLPSEEEITAMFDPLHPELTRTALEARDAAIAQYDYNTSLREQIRVQNLVNEAKKTETDLLLNLYNVSHSGAQVLANSRRLRLLELEAQERAARLVPGTLTNIQRQIDHWEDLNKAMSDAGLGADKVADIITKGLLGELSGAEVGKQLGDMFVNGIRSSLAQRAAQQITDIINQYLMQPLFDAIIKGSSVTAAVNALLTQENIDKMLEKAANIGTALALVLNDPKFLEAMEKLRKLFGNLVSGGGLPSGAGTTGSGGQTDGYWDWSTGYGVWHTGSQGQAEDPAAAAARILNARLEMMARIYEMTGDAANYAAVQEMQHAIALEALDPSLRGLQVQIWQLEAAAEATAKSMRFVDAESDLLIQLARAYGNEAQAIELERDAIRRRIEEEWGEGTAAANRLIGMYEELWAIQGDVGDGLADWKDQIRDWLNGNLLDQNLSPLTAQQQYVEAQKQYEATLLAAQGGDQAAIGRLTQEADSLLTLAKAVEGFGGGYSALWEQVRLDLSTLIGQPELAMPTAGESLIVSELQATREELRAAQIEANRLTERLIEATREAGTQVAGTVENSTAQQTTTLTSAETIDLKR